MIINKQYITNNYQETQQIAEEFAKDLQGGEVLCLYGDLGYGKTTFVQGLAKGLGIKGKIISPTFIIMRTYKGNLISSSSDPATGGRVEKSNQNSPQLINFYHVDLYRINSEKEIVDLGLLDIINQPESIVAIEWSEKMGKLLSGKRIDVKFKYIDESKRIIDIDSSEI